MQERNMKVHSLDGLVRRLSDDASRTRTAPIGGVVTGLDGVANTSCSSVDLSQGSGFAGFSGSGFAGFSGSGFAGFSGSGFAGFSGSGFAGFSGSGFAGF
jgi:hypothetical protein